MKTNMARQFQTELKNQSIFCSSSVSSMHSANQKSVILRRYECLSACSCAGRLAPHAPREESALFSSPPLKSGKDRWINYARRKYPVKRISEGGRDRQRGDFNSRQQLPGLEAAIVLLLYAQDENKLGAKIALLYIIPLKTKSRPQRVPQVQALTKCVFSF